MPDLGGPEYRLTRNVSELPLEQVFGLLRTTHWAANRRREVQAAAIASSLNFGAVDAATGEVLGYARVITDQATFAYLCDVVVHPDRRGKGIGTALVRYVQEQPELQGLRRWVLATTRAHRLYEAAGWEPLADPSMWMERFAPVADGPRR